MMLNLTELVELHALALQRGIDSKTALAQSVWELINDVHFLRINLWEARCLGSTRPA